MSQIDLGQVAATVTIGTTTTGAYGTQASVSNSGTTQNAVFNFTIPSANYPIVNQTSSSTSISPGCLNVWGEVSSLSITLATPTDATIVNEYMIQFESGSTATTLSMPSSVEWAESCGSLSVEANKTYQISIVNNIGLWAAIANS